MLNKEQERVVQELRELARAIQAYFIDDSKSLRRRQAIQSATSEALDDADEAFGPESGMTIEYVCPCCKVPMCCVGTNEKEGDHGNTIDLYFECMTCAHLLSIVVNVPNGNFIPVLQMWNYSSTRRL